MIEFLKHLFGFCGEHWHPTIFHFLMGGVSASSLWLWIKSKYKHEKNCIKTTSEPLDHV